MFSRDFILHKLKPTKLELSFRTQDVYFTKRFKKMKCEARGCTTSTLIVPYCRYHTQQLLKCTVAPTSLKNVSGKGLFAAFPESFQPRHDNVVFRKDDIIAPYIGEVTSKFHIDQQYGMNTTARYALGFLQEDNVVIDAAVVRSTGAYANTLYGGDSTTLKTCPVVNACFTYTDPIHFPVLTATTDILDGEEIFCDYGVGRFFSDYDGAEWKVYRVH